LVGIIVGSKVGADDLLGAVDGDPVLGLCVGAEEGDFVGVFVGIVDGP